MKLLVIGGGGREHALAWKLSQGRGVSGVYVCPGNPGMALDSGIECTGIGAGEFDAIAKFAKEKRVEFVVVGPDQALADGAVDYLESRAIPAFGPSKQASRIEWSKAYSKELMKKASISTARYETFSDFSAAEKFLNTVEWGKGWVVKADGLALGKGVVVAEDPAQAIAAAQDFLNGSGKRVVIEERLIGREVSAFFLCDGTTAVPMGMACDYKRIFDGDKGPNTGGMGAFTPADWVPSDLMERARTEIALPLLKAMSDNPFKGMLFIGLMVDGSSYWVLEFNARFGDPETQALLPMIDEDLYPWLRASRDGRLGNMPVSGPRLRNGAAVHVVLAAEGYPGTPRKGDAIESTASNAVKVFYAGVSRQGGGLATAGGRVMGVTALASSRADARKAAYEGVAKISFKGMQRRNDVGA